ncbi:ABC transporter permease [Paenactinomyces guangxiensis]|uniref:FtsX-like permease family protein n=1 Tax=Paenactinomyces guangxiensis TaxID=1490290 RepID=A0A7W1WT06_9BACL|nr:FtsX-like permease family protein [Paenactinomyces guangxiensis]MBA4495447.1 FtsX-like permease family protein [Paenactinomyces guangxiensis]MBH8592430.1 FtsX-like permease family protein [Paenactinomyces guangxiensis]
MSMLSILLGSISLLLILYSFLTAWRHPHLWKMAFRNIRLHKTTTFLTIIGSMVGTSLITSALLLQTSIVHSMDLFFEEQYGNIYSDIPSAGQPKLEHPYFVREDLPRLQADADSASGPAEFVPTVGFYGNLAKLNDSGKPLIIQPHVYIHAFDFKDAKQFDAKAVKSIPKSLDGDEIILSKRAAVHLEVKEGDEVQLVLPKQNPLTLTVKKVVAEQGLTGYRGEKRGTATALLSLNTARSLLGMKEGYTNVLSSSNLPFDGWKQSYVRNDVKYELDGILKFTPFFLIASLNAIIIGVALVLNIFKMIADERKQELGILRAVGMNRQDLARILRLEGMLYAIGSSLVGVAAGAGLAYAVFWRLADIFNLSSQYSTQVVVTYHFYIDAISLLAGLTIGILLICLCMEWVARRVAKVAIVELLNERDSEKQEAGQKRKQTGFRSLAALLTGLLFTALVTITPQYWFQKWLAQYQGITTFVNVGLGIAAIATSIAFAILCLPFIYLGIQKFFAFMPRMYGVLGVAFRYPELNKKRTGLLLFMFTMVLFLTGFSGIINATFGAVFGGWDGRTATGGYDLTARTNRVLSTAELEQMIYRSAYIDHNQIQSLATVVQLPFKDYNDRYVNGIDASFAQNNSLQLQKRDPAFSDDRAVWKEVARNPDVMVLGEEEVDGKRYQIGEFFPLQPGVEKKIIGISRHQKESYGFYNFSSIWIKQSEMKTLAGDSRQLESTLLIQVKNPKQLGQVAKSIEKAFTLQGIYPLQNPQQYFVANQSFSRTILSLLEGFSALATVVGIVGLMVVMFRAVRERRQQMGMMRAIGMGKGFIFWSILIEGAVIAITGILLGVGLGCFVGLLIINAVFSEGTPDTITVIFPYGKILMYFVGALLFTLICSSIPARQTFQLSPVEATRYVS